MATANMGMTLPTEGGSSGVWDTLLNAAMELIDDHDHTSGKGVLVPTAGLSIDADKDWQDRKITNLQAIRFNGGETAITGYTKGLTVKTDNELYWVTSGGTAVKLTNGTSLNVALVGGITGDYSTTTADLEYDDATKIYEFKQDETPDHWAKIKCGDIHLTEPTSGITNAVVLKSPTSLAAAYDVTFPAALPGATSVVLMSSAGDLSTTLTPTVTTLTTTGNLISGANVVAAAGDLLHADRTVQVSAAEGQRTAGSWAFVERLPSAGAPPPHWATPGNGDTVTFNITLPDHRCQLKSVTAVIQDTTGAHTVSMQLGEVGLENATYAQIGSTQTSDGLGAANGQDLTISGLTESSFEKMFVVTITADDATTTTHKVFGILYAYDRIA